MEQLIFGTSAYRILSQEAKSDKLSHSYMLYFADPFNLRSALKLFARNFFPEEKPSLIDSEGLSDLKIYPAIGEKLTADIATQIVEDSAIRPIHHDKKLYIIDNFSDASPIFQNKLLKVLEEPPQGVYFLLGVTSLSPVLDTVRSRVKLLEIAPFTEEEIFCALQRRGEDERNRAVAQNCGGVLGEAENMLKGQWYKEVRRVAEEICAVTTLKDATKVSQKVGDFKYKKELLTAMQANYFKIVQAYAKDGEYSNKISKGTAIYAVESINKALADLKFNANFSSLMYDLLLRISSKR
ncbi:MAG: hypothetical protein ACI4MS_01435 [Candidatus Coproplasma sp.]